MADSQLNWIRTYPVGTPDDLVATGRRFVWDQHTERVAMDTDYRPVLAALDASTVITEWDIAFSAEHRDLFGRYCLEDPARVHVAPYRLYPVSTGLAAPVWAHRVADGWHGYRWVNERDKRCDLFGFGMVYLPLSIVTRYLSDNSGIATDSTFSLWHDHSGEFPAVIHWDVRPIHLHY